MEKNYDVIVAGVGSMGAAACRHLAGRGVSVLGLEQFDIPHGRGAHHGHSRMIRQSYSENPAYVPLLKRAYTLWEELEKESGYELLHLTGGLYLGARGADVLTGALAAAKEYDLPHAVLDHAALRERFPQFHVPENFEGFHEERAGLLLPDLAVCAHVERALADGADIRAREPIVSWETEGDGVIVKTTRDTYRAGHLVFTAGAWTGPLLRDLGVSLTVTRQVLAWFWPREPEAFARDRFPCWCIESEPPFLHYGFPMMPGQPGIKVALHKPGAEIDPDVAQEVALQPTDGEVDALRGALARYIPGAAGEVTAARICIYTNSPDGDFIIDRHPEIERVTLACGFSGHGFKFCSVVGEILADLALEGESGHPVGHMGLGRFG